MNLLQKKQSKRIIIHFGITAFAIVSTGIVNMVYEKFFNPKEKISNTLVPATVIAFYAICILYFYLYYQNYCKGNGKNLLLKNIGIFLFVFGFAEMATALLIGGLKYEFKICAKVYSAAFLVWLTTIVGSYVYYKIKMNKNMIAD